MNNIKSFYLLKDEILSLLSLKKYLLIFKYNKKYQQLLELYPNIYELYTNIQKDFEPYNENIKSEMFSYATHLNRVQKNFSNDLMLKYYFHFLLNQKNIYVEYDNINFALILNYLNSKRYTGNLIIKLTEPKLNLDLRPNIEIKGEYFYLEINFDMKWVDREKKENIEYFKNFLEKKIAGEDTRNHVTKINFLEDINLNEEKYEDFFFDQLYAFPNAMFNIQSIYFDDNNYWSQIDRFSRLKFIINEILNSNDDIENKNLINENEISNNNKDEEFITKIKHLNTNIKSIRNLNNFILDFRKNKINITSEFFNSYKTKDNSNLKNILPYKITLINFIYEKNKEYFEELNNKINNFNIIQRIYKNTPYPLFISPNLQSLKVLKLERINILEENLVSIIDNNPLLEIFEIHKNYTGYIFGYNLALALSNLNFLKSLTTEYFWYKEYIPHFIQNEIINKQENEFYKFFKSKSLNYLYLSNETNINIKTLNENLPNLISLSMEHSNIILENNEININSNPSSIRNKYKKKMSEKLNLINNNTKKEENNIYFKRIRDLSLSSIQNSEEFFHKMSLINKIENLYLEYFDTNFFETFIKYGENFTNLDTLYLYPDLNEKIIKSNDMINLVKKIHYFEKLTTLIIGFFYINENLVNELYDQLIKLSLLTKLKIYVKNSTIEEKEMLQNKINEIKIKSANKQYFTITYIFLDQKFR